MWAHPFLFSPDLKKYNQGKRQIEPNCIDKFDELSATERHYVSYCHPDTICEVFTKGIHELHANASPAEIIGLVTKAKVVRLAKLIKINAANITRLAQAKMPEQVLEVALTDGFDDEDFLTFEKGKESGPFPDRLSPDPTSGVQLTSRKTIIRPTGRKGKKTNDLKVLM